MDEHRLVKMALDQGLITQAQLDKAEVERQALADRGIEHDLWFLVQDLGYLSDEGARRLRKGMSSSTLKALEVEGYTIQGRIGSGGMGDVFRGVRSGNDHVAIKLLSSKFLTNPEYQERFTREANAGIRLDHPHLVRSLSTGEVAGCRYLMMELVEGPSLKARIVDSGPLTEREALALILQIGDALRYAWANQVLHRDVKPANIILAKAPPGSGEPFIAKLCDFGLAKVWQHNEAHELQAGQLTGAGLALGTPHYMSPEQASGEQDLDQRSDIYGLAASLYHALLGQTMYSGKSSAVIMYKQVTESLDLAPLIRKNINPKLVRLLEKMLQKDRRKRIATWEAVLADTLTIADGGELAPRTATVRALQSRRQQSTLRGVAIGSVVAVGLAAALGLAGWALLGSHGGPHAATPASLALVLAEAGISGARTGHAGEVVLAPGVYEGPWRLGAGHAGLILRGGPDVVLTSNGAPALRCESGATTIQLRGLTCHATDAPAIEILAGARIRGERLVVTSTTHPAVLLAGHAELAECAVRGGIVAQAGSRLECIDTAFSGAVQITAAATTFRRCRLEGSLAAEGGSLSAATMLIQAPGDGLRLVRVERVELADVEIRAGAIAVVAQGSALSRLAGVTLLAPTPAEWIGAVDPQWVWSGLRWTGAAGLPGQDGRGTGADQALFATLPPAADTLLRNRTP
jgi:serine/threonine-protein kinase